MANELDEMTGPVLEQGNDVKVIAKQIPVKVGTGSKVFDIIWWFIPPVIGGVVWLIMKMKAKNYFQQLQQKIQEAASTVDNYLEQRVQILKNCARLVEKAIDLDKDTFSKIAAYRGGINPENDDMRNKFAADLDEAGKSINLAFENYPELRAHQELADAMQQNSYLQREITAAREVYNNVVARWNKDIFRWPTYQIVAAKEGYTTRIPFAADAATKEAARGEFF